MDPITKDGQYRNMKVLSMVQETRLILVCEEMVPVATGEGSWRDEPAELEIVVDSNRRPIPVPYSEEP